MASPSPRRGTRLGECLRQSVAGRAEWKLANLVAQRYACAISRPHEQAGRQEMAHVELDAIDRRILSILQENGRLSNQDIAERVNLSPSPCLRRIRRLEEMGVITGYVALLDPQKLGLDLLAYVSVRLEKRGGVAPVRGDETSARAGATHAELFRAAVQAWPEVVACHAMTGDMDYLLRVQVEDMAHFSRFMQEQLLHHPSVIDVKTSFSLERFKETTALPIR
ncbi:putative leucine-responsive regulatory protein [Burkholderia mallei SAVP1]|nr:transcriptional regulator, AsnC family [Burkholderia mallei SAVP1]ABM52211.1 putative leucine-responsive regulatory protein [Burkholderia mallei SAVP1]